MVIDIPRAVAALYEESWTTREIGDVFSADSKTIWRWLDRLQVPRRRRGPRGRTDVSDDDIRELVDDQQLSYAQVAAIVGMSKSGVRQRYWRVIGRARTERGDHDQRGTTAERNP